MSLFRRRSIHSPAHQAIPSLGIAPPSCYVRQYTGILAPLVIRKRIHDLKFLLPVNVQPPQLLRHHSALVYYLYALYA